MDVRLSSEIPENILGADNPKTQAKLRHDQELCRVRSTADLCLEQNAEFYSDILVTPLVLHQGARTFLIEPGCLDWGLPMVRQAPSLARRRHPEPCHRLCRWLAPAAS